MSIADKIIAEARAEREAQGYDQRWIDSDGNISLYRGTASSRPIAAIRCDTETACHCTSPYRGSDHCPECGCEQYESGDCGHTQDPQSPNDPAHPNY